MASGTASTAISTPASRQVTISGPPATITNTLASTNGLVYTPPGNFIGRLALVAVVEDHGNSGATVPNPSLTQTVTIPMQVIALNDPPVAGPDFLTTNEDTSVTVAVSVLLSNDLPGPAGETGQVRIVANGFSASANGSVSYANGNVVYTPAANFNGPDTFTYTIDDGNPLSTAMGTVSVTVMAVNDRPTAANDTLETTEDTAVTIAAGGLTVNDSPGPANESGQPLRLVPGGFSVPAHGTVTFDGFNVVYTPQPNYNGPDSFTYTIDDGDPASTAVAMVAVSVTAVNDPPLAGNDAFNTSENIAVTIAVATLLSNDKPGPADESAQRVRLVPAGFGGPTFGNLQHTGPTVVYTPPANFHGVDTFTYTIDDGNPASTAVGTVTLTVIGVNDPPIAANDFLAATEDTPVTVAGSVLLSNDSPGPADESWQVLSIVSGGFGTPAHGTVMYIGTNVVYTPGADFHGTDTFTYSIQDGDPAFTAVGTVTVTVTPVNDPPVAVNDAVTTAEDTVVTVAVAVLLANDRPGPANEGGSVRLVPGGFGTPTLGTLAYDGTNVVYTPPADYQGTDTFTYTIDDGNPASTATGTVTVTITAMDDPPVAGGDTVVTAEDTAATVTAATLLSNDRPGPANESGQTVRIVPGGFGAPSHGTVAYDAVTLRLVYTPELNYFGADSFTYTIDDGNAASTAVGTVSVTVTAVNDPPVAGSNSVAIAEDSAATVAVTALLSNDVPGPANEVGQTVRLVPGGFGPASFGTVAYNAGTGNVVYTPSANFHGTDTFTYTIDDGDPVSTAVGTVTVTVTAVNDPPVALNDSVTATEDTAATVAASVLLSNDLPGPANESGQTLRIVSVGTPSQGTATYNAGTGNVVYTPPANFNGTATFTYTIDDGVPASTAVGTVTVTVTAVNDPPAAIGDSMLAMEDAAATVAVTVLLSNDRPGTGQRERDKPSASCPAVLGRRSTGPWRTMPAPVTSSTRRRRTSTAQTPSPIRSTTAIRRRPRSARSR